MNYTFDFSVIWENIDVLMAGAWLTLKISVLAIATMRETTPTAMPPCFDKWCKRFDDLLRTKAQKREFRHYLGGLSVDGQVFSDRRSLSKNLSIY